MITNTKTVEKNNYRIIVPNYSYNVSNPSTYLFLRNFNNKSAYKETLKMTITP